MYGKTSNKYKTLKYKRTETEYKEATNAEIADRTIEQLVQPILTQEDKDLILASDQEKEQANKRSKKTSFKVSTLTEILSMSSIGYGIILCNDYNISQPTGIHPIIPIAIGIIGTISASFISILRKVYNNMEFKQSLYKKYPESQIVLQDLYKLNNLKYAHTVEERIKIKLEIKLDSFWGGPAITKEEAKETTKKLKESEKEFATLSRRVRYLKRKISDPKYYSK